MFKLKRKLNLSALEVLEKHEQMLLDECLTHAHQLGVISKSLVDNWEKTIRQEVDFIISVTRGRDALRNTILDIKKNKEIDGEDKAEFRYQISSLFLKDCWQYLKSDPGRNERLHLVTGSITRDGTRVLSRMEKVRYGQQSAAYVSAEKNDSHQRLVALAEDHGHLVLGVFHSHMSSGKTATTPSSIDQSFLQRMAKIGCDCLGGIFSLDGYVRFFVSKEDFQIEVYGKGVNKLHQNPTETIFKIV